MNGHESSSWQSLGLSGLQISSWPFMNRPQRIYIISNVLMRCDTTQILPEGEGLGKGLVIGTPDDDHDGDHEDCHQGDHLP